MYSLISFTCTSYLYLVYQICILIISVSTFLHVRVNLYPMIGIYLG